ncbi:hypothetical protein ACIQGZ_16430 [Streptomyces sp. NPDC092296]|uniref:mechanosensitive ion channel family protein n=1 Tax=Streptomyces sp. NPDC092296 TaxID=3366012 RepID=UPI003804954D
MRSARSEEDAMLNTTTLAAVDVTGGISNAWSAVATFVPKFVAFLVILVIGWVIARIVAKAVGAVLGRVGFERVAERAGIARALERSTWSATEIIAKLVYYALLLITLQIAFSVFGNNPISLLLKGALSWLPKLAVAVVIVIVMAAIASGARTLIRGALGTLPYAKPLAMIASVFIIGLGLIAALNQIGVAITVTMPVLIAVLASLAGILIVGVGGGMIRPMQQRWERWLTSAEGQTEATRSQIEAYQRGRQDARGAVAPETAGGATSAEQRRRQPPDAER